MRGHDCEFLVFHCSLCKESVFGFLYLTADAFLGLFLAGVYLPDEIGYHLIFFNSRSLSPDLMHSMKMFKSAFSRLAFSPAAIFSSGDGSSSWFSMDGKF